MNSMEESKKWFVYILLCSDKSLYTGITNNLKKRLNSHNSGKGSKYTRSRRPVEILHVESVSDRSQALKREYEIKKWSRSKKIKYLQNNNVFF